MTPVRCLAVLVAAFAAGASARPADAQTAPPETAPERFFAQHCITCHGPEKQKGDLRFDTVDFAVPDDATAELLATVVEVLEAGEMPPADEPQPPPPEREAAVRWLRAQLDDAAGRFAAGRAPVLRRLTRAQYSRALQDLLQVPVDFGRELPPDARSRTGFHNDGTAQRTSTLHIDGWQQIARRALDASIAFGERPEPARYRVTFGRGIGRGQVAAEVGGFQSVPLAREDFLLELLDRNGATTVPADDAERRRLDALRRRIGVGLRGSAQDRFQVLDDGLVLLAALPHKETPPGSWQGPSPNLKLEMQRCWPDRGPFALRVVAGRGTLPPLRKQLLLALDEPVPLVRLADDGVTIQPSEQAQVLPAQRSDQRHNLRVDGDALLPEDVPQRSSARLGFELPADGFYQLDLVHRPVAAAAMPQVRVQLAGHHLDLRLAPTDEQLRAPHMVTPLGVAGLLRGRHHVTVGGPFFVGFTALVVTPLPADHALRRRLTADVAAQNTAVASLTPSIQPFCGTRTDDGMDYRTFGPSTPVAVDRDAAQCFEFTGWLEDLPIPEPESGDTEELSGYLLVGLWNDHLANDPAETGPPLWLRSIEFEAPFHPVWPPPSHAAIFPPGDRTDLDGYTRALLRRFATRAFRRPVDDDEIERYLAFWRAVRDHQPSYEHAVREVLVAMLCSPHFLFLCEPDLPRGAPLPDWALANRLSFFLWDAPPDDELRAIAAEGRLSQELLPQVDRLLDDDRSRDFVRAFASDWLRLDRLDGVTMDVARFPDFTRFVKRDMARETLGMVHRVIADDRSLLTWIHSDFAMLNHNLARFYGIDGVTGDALRPVPVAPAQHRGGLLSQGAFLAGHSDGHEPHPIKRAVWLCERLLGDPPPPPPPNVPQLDQGSTDTARLTLKERLEQHRDSASCRDCHAGIDPYGIPFERLDAVGRFAPERFGRPVDAAAVMPDGTEVDGDDGLQRYLLTARRDDFVRSVAEHLLAYALGRELRFDDAPHVARIVHETKIAGCRARALVRSIVASDVFRCR